MSPVFMHDTSKSGTTVKRHPSLAHSFWKVCCLYYTTLSHQLIIRFYLLQHTHYNLAEFQAKSSIVYSCKTSRAKQKAHLFIPCLFLGKLTNDFDRVPQKMHLVRCEPVNSCSATQSSETSNKPFSCPAFVFRSQVPAEA